MCHKCHTLIPHSVLSSQLRGSKLNLKSFPNAGILTIKRRRRRSNAQTIGVLGAVSNLPCPGVIQQMIVLCVTTVYPIICYQIPWHLVLCPKEKKNMAGLIVLSTDGNDAIQWNWNLKPMNLCPCYSNVTMYHLILLSITLRRNPWVSFPENVLNLIVILWIQSPIPHGWWIPKDVSNI